MLNGIIRALWSMLGVAVGLIAIFFLGVVVVSVGLIAAFLLGVAVVSVGLTAAFYAVYELYKKKTGKT